MDRTSIENKIEEFRTVFLDEKWVWRKGQKDAIISIIETYVNKTNNVVILDAPVGSGKSIIALCSSWILNQIGKKGYILASDIALQEQYEKDLHKISLGYGSVKGIDNYMCIDNLEKNSLGTCRIRSKSPKSMHCYDECPYFGARDRASKSSTSLLNYAYWLIMQNYANQHSDEQFFPKRDFTFCDEAHKILDIIQNHYAPRFDKNLKEKLEKLTNFFIIHHMKNYSAILQSIIVDVKILYAEDNQDRLHEILSRIEENVESYIPSYEKLKESIKINYPKDTPPKEWREALNICEWVKDFHCKLEDYCDIIEQTSTRNIIKNPSSDTEIVFNCLEESYMMKKYFHQWTGFTILMSATFADPLDYLRSISLPGAKYIKVASTFNFDKSPIYFYNKRKMSYTQIEANLPWLCSTINNILDKHPTENGIIHSASYSLTMKIMEGLSPRNKKRMLVYSGTQEKKQVLEILKRDNSKVLLGPSLIEGLDLKDNISRFQIFAKVPYLSLSDKFVKVKMQLNPAWYRWTAIINILQGTGRSVRHETDYAVTYILDASLADLIHNSRKSFPSEFMARIKIVSD